MSQECRQGSPGSYLNIIIMTIIIIQSCPEASCSVFFFVVTIKMNDQEVEIHIPRSDNISDTSEDVDREEMKWERKQ